VEARAPAPVYSPLTSNGSISAATARRRAVAAGQAARACEAILQLPRRDKRGLNEQELAALRKEMIALHAAAQKDLQSTLCK
jgi:hypothetical protein